MSDRKINNLTDSSDDSDDNDDSIVENFTENRTVVETVVTTQDRTPTINNTITVELGKTVFHVCGWKACAVETVVLGFTLLGAIAAGYHGVDIARSLKSRFF